MRFRRAPVLHCVLCLMSCSVALDAQQLIDRVLARVGTTAVPMTDVRIAIELGLVEAPGQNQQSVALQRTIDRQLHLNDAARVAPPEPAVAAAHDETAAVQLRAAADRRLLMTS